MRPRAPVLQHAAEQRRAVVEAAVEAAFGDAEVLRQHLDPHALDAGSREFRESGLDPGVAALSSVMSVAHVLDTAPYC